MMEWVEGFLKIHKRQQAFDDAWQEIPPYPRFSVPKRAYLEVTQWQGKEMRNLGRCISAVLASALRNPDSSQDQDFNIALKCVGALVDVDLMTQYRSHTPDTLAYMERNLQTFHQTKDIFLEFRTSKSTRADVNRQNRELRRLMAYQIAQEAHHISAAQRHRQADQNRLQRVYRRADLIQRENHFNFIKMHYLSHFVSHVRRCNDPTTSSYNHNHLSPNCVPRGNPRWYGLVYFIQIAGKPRIRPRQVLSSFEVLY